MKVAVIYFESVVEWIERLHAEAVESDSIPGWVEPKTQKIGAYLLDVQQFKGQYEASAVRSR